ncbi:MMPL family transporter [Myxococcota bacterium]|nr:MMPL family transporter [Myxococcota bacterium]
MASTPSFEEVLSKGLRARWIGLAIALAVGVTGAIVGRDIPIRLSIAHLLPDDKPSVLDLETVSAEVGGIGYLGVLVGPIDEPERYLAAIADVMAKRDDIRFVYYEREQYLMRRRALYLIPRADFDAMIAASRTILLEGSSMGPIDLGVDTDEERAANVAEAKRTFERLRRDHLHGEAGLDGRAQRYFLSKDGRHAMLFAKPSFDSEDLGKSRALVAGAQADVAAVLGDRVPFRLWGRYVNQNADTKQIESDIAKASILSVVSIFVVLILGLGSVRAAIVTLGCVVVSIGWTAGFIALAVGQINIITGFMLAILSGLGVEYGIHLVRRYHQERREGRSHDDAVRSAYLHVGRALLSAALTSAGAFLILKLSDFRGFSELGLIAGFGVLSIYAVYMLAFPALSGLLTARVRLVRVREAFGVYPVSRRWIWIAPAFVAVVAWGVHDAEFESNLARMRKLSDEANGMNNLVTELMGGRSTTPAAVLAKSPEQAEDARVLLDGAAFKPTIEHVISLHSVVPVDQAERSRALEPLRRRVKKLGDEDLKEKLGFDPTLVRDWLAERPYTRAELPPHLSDPFGKSGSVIAVYTSESLDLIPGLRRFSQKLLAAKERFPELKIGTDAVILTEIVDYVMNDGKLVMALFLVGAFFVMWLDFRSMREAALLEVQLVLGIVLLVALMGLFHVRFSILNVAMVPAVLAAGIDMGVHIRHRELEGREGSIASARYVAQSVQLGALTTLLGFGSLFVAQAEMLRGIAWISVLGQISMYVVCMVLVPVVRDAFHPRLPEAPRGVLHVERRAG